MAYSPDEYTGDGSTNQFTVTFPYIAQTHVHVYLDGVEKTVDVDWQWLDSTTIDFSISSAPASGVNVKIQRETPTSRLVDYQDAGNITEAKLDKDGNQLAYVMEEIDDNFQDILQRSSSDSTVWDAESARITNVADPTADQDAATRKWVNDNAIAGGDVPSPANPGDNNKVLRATNGTYGWYSFLIDWISDAAAFMKTFLKSNDQAAARSNLGAGTTGDALFTEANASGGRTTLGLGDSAIENVDVAGGVQGYDSAVRTSGAQTVGGNKTFSGSNTHTGKNFFNSGTSVGPFNQGTPTGGTVNLNLNQSDDFEMTLGGNITLGAFSNADLGQSGIIYVSQDATGSRTMSYDASFEFEEGVVEDVSSAANSLSALAYHVRAIDGSKNATSVTLKVLRGVA